MRVPAGRAVYKMWLSGDWECCSESPLGFGKMSTFEVVDKTFFEFGSFISARSYIAVHSRDAARSSITVHSDFPARSASPVHSNVTARSPIAVHSNMTAHFYSIDRRRQLLAKVPKIILD